MKAFLFPGQGAQFEGMGKDLILKNSQVEKYFQQADEILGFGLSDVMFNGSAENLKQTKITQPAIFLYSVAMAQIAEDLGTPNFVAGHSLGELSALVANKCLSFESGLQLVSKRALAMQKACEMQESTMAAIIGLENEVVENICAATDGIVVAANYNCPGQLVISGAIAAIDLACEKLTEAGARRALKLPVGGAFHSPLMEPAREELAAAIEKTEFSEPICPIVQNATAKASDKADEIKTNLIAQLTAPVKWTQSINQIIEKGGKEFIEIGPGKVLTGLMRKIDRSQEAKKYEL